MQMLLTLEEYDALVPSSELRKHKEALEWVRKRFVGQRCIHGDPDWVGERFNYCSECPLGRFFEDGGPSKELRRYVCSHDKEYSK